MIRFLLLFSRQGKLRLQKWFTPMTEREKKKITRDMTTMVLSRQPRSCNFLHWKDLKIIYRENGENELIALEVIHRYVELLDKYFGNVCELDIIFNFEKAYFILDEFLMGGEIQETSKQMVNRSIEASDMLQEGIRLHPSRSFFTVLLFIYGLGRYLLVPLHLCGLNFLLWPPLDLPLDHWPQISVRLPQVVLDDPLVQVEGELSLQLRLGVPFGDGVGVLCEDFGRQVCGHLVFNIATFIVFIISNIRLTFQWHFVEF
ncbi:hypothetical protein F7725_011543 [Dissostichus mawsoni]|uniref:AP complex mu/sigma subunit domain-containing protein n=1 Tax=Dissostichus mawsoni TaxID=36200 RepID=A0A7J5Z968_DISMA|nr:hypothetical protein F7725_011543 [Dissostichus mawsoni]